ncbi:hypothetical protein M514_06240 [Trichuris suis]|uniref:Uncharacterized protein n=1 Tax=Trichuris suis TaxID=68888 RepID=A0A085M6T4_9BILA|nr:hypothetical protein M513_06240 [Trichuris suis]KFD63749.1 hypothetical protein M514_06240 [Trichuris suis]
MSRKVHDGRSFSFNSKRTGICQILYDRLKTHMSCPVSYKAVRHIWQRHGCYENALKEMKRNRRRKMPSYYYNSRVLYKAVTRTYVNPNWIRTEPNGWRSRRSSSSTSSPALASCERRRHLARSFYFKSFRRSIGMTGIGYCRDRKNDNTPCSCSAVLVDGRSGLVTSYPMKENDAEMAGKGPCKFYNTEKEDLPDFSEYDEDDYSTSHSTSDDGDV